MSRRRFDVIMTLFLRCVSVGKVHLGCQMLHPPGQMNIFQNKDVHILKNMANQIIRIVENIETHNEDQTA